MKQTTIECDEDGATIEPGDDTREPYDEAADRADNRTASFSGQSEARGRNGWFKLASGQWRTLYRLDPEHPIHIGLSSRRTGEFEPIVLKLTRADAALLVALVEQALADKDGAA